MDWFKKRINEFPKIKKTLISLNGLRYKTKMVLLNKALGINNKKVVFISFGGKQYSDNPRAISEKLHEMHPDFKIVWLFIKLEEKKHIVPNYVKCIKANSFSAIRELATAKFWIDNAGKSIYTYKSKGQVYIQTWHGDRGFKKVLYDAWPNGQRPNPVIESTICDLMTSGSDFYDRVISSAFRFNGCIMKVGSPRNDLLLHFPEDKILSIKNKIGIPNEKKVLMYAPTFRDSQHGSAQKIEDIDLSKTITELNDKTNDDWVCLVRAHSAVKGFDNDYIMIDSIMDVTGYEDMSELLLISDFLITDYSSSAGDFALLKRPIILFQSDREEYLRDDRTFYFDIDKSPFTVVFNQEQLNKAIQELDIEKAKKQCEEILNFYGTVETGHAAQSVVEYMLDKIEIVNC